jgi:transcriptional regulator with XRE-family HTH domain
VSARCLHLVGRPAVVRYAQVEEVLIAVLPAPGYHPGSSRAFGETRMDIAKRLRELREAKRLSQGDISERSGLTHSYISRVECGHAIPTIQILERWSNALGVPLSQLFTVSRAGATAGRHQTGVRLSKEGKRFLALLKRMDEPDRRLWFSLGVMIAKAQRARQ